MYDWMYELTYDEVVASVSENIRDDDRIAYGDWDCEDPNDGYCKGCVISHTYQDMAGESLDDYHGSVWAGAIYKYDDYMTKKYKMRYGVVYGKEAKEVFLNCLEEVSAR